MAARGEGTSTRFVDNMRWCGCGSGARGAGAAHAGEGQALWRVALAEGCGAALLVLLTCAAGCAPSATDFPLQRALASGLVIALLVQCLDHVSGAQFNPAVTLAALLCGRVSRRRALGSAAAQLAGAALGAGLLAARSAAGAARCVTAPAARLPAWQAAGVEALLGGRVSRRRALGSAAAQLAGAALGAGLLAARSAAGAARCVTAPAARLPAWQAAGVEALLGGRVSRRRALGSAAAQLAGAALGAGLLAARSAAGAARCVTAPAARLPAWQAAGVEALLGGRVSRRRALGSAAAQLAGAALGAGLLAARSAAGAARCVTAPAARLPAWQAAGVEALLGGRVSRRRALGSAAAQLAGAALGAGLLAARSAAGAARCVTAPAARLPAWQAAGVEALLGGRVSRRRALGSAAAQLAGAALGAGLLAARSAAGAARCVTAPAARLPAWQAAGVEALLGGRVSRRRALGSAAAQLAGAALGAGLLAARSAAGAARCVTAPAARLPAWQAAGVEALLGGRVSRRRALGSAAAQLAGAALGAGLLAARSAAGAARCVTAPAARLPAWQAAGVEALLGGCLALANCAAWDPRNAGVRDSWPLRVGLSVAGLSLVAGELTGASMNPVRSFGPALWSGNWTSHWVYWVGPLSGSALFTSVYMCAWRPYVPHVAARSDVTPRGNQRGVSDAPPLTSKTVAEP